MGEAGAVSAKRHHHAGPARPLRRADHHLTPLFVQRSWLHARVLLIGAILAPGRRTVTSVPRIIRRFLIHVLPSGFHSIRPYGLLASGTRAAAMARARELLTATRAPDRPDQKTEDRIEELSRELRPCPCCGGRMLVIETFERGRAPLSRLPSAFAVDTS